MTPEVKKSIDEIITREFRREGNFSNSALDSGAATKYGITQQRLGLHRDAEVTVEDVQALTEAEARAIYEQDFVIGPGFADLFSGRMLELVVDSGIQHGPEIAVSWLQELVGTERDGKLGPVTEDAVHAADPGKLYEAYWELRADFYRDRVERHPDQARWIKGWLARLEGFRPPGLKLFPAPGPGLTVMAPVTVDGRSGVIEEEA